MKISRTSLIASIMAFWAFIALLSWTHTNFFGVLNTLGFASLLIIPGFLTVLGLGGGEHKLPFWHRFGQVIAWSILEIMVFILLCNTLLPHLHLARPLDRRPLVIELSFLCTGLAAWSYYRLKGSSFGLSLRHIFKSKLDALFVVASMLFVPSSIMGAISLNNGSTGNFTVAMLIGMAGYMSLLFGFRKRLHDNTFATAIYMMGLSLLLMTSLRSWYTTGHDVQREYRVFRLSQASGLWNIKSFRDPFNACLSITILPTVLANLLHIPDPYVYKVYFQLIFAVVPVLVYLLMRRYLSRGKSYLSAIYFIAFPTFFTDMSMLNRQEIAFLFLALMLLVIFDTRIALKRRRGLFLAFALGMVLSHYSTTYSVIFILVLLLITRPIFNLLAPRLANIKLFKDTGIRLPNSTTKKMRPNITIVMVLLIIASGLLWNSVLTNTSTAGNVVRTTFDSLTHGRNENSRSSDVSYSLLASAQSSPQQQLQDYLRYTVAPERAAAPKDTYFAASSVDAYPLMTTPATTAPLTLIGQALSHSHINVTSLNYALKQTTAKLLQIFLIIGLVYVLIHKRLGKKIEPEYLLLSLGCLIFLALQVVLPYLSVAYGLLRAFQQSLMITGLFIVVGTYALCIRFKSRRLKHGIPAALAIAFFLTSTGVVSQLLGGYQPLLHLGNSGQYYDAYYLHSSEVVESSWLQNLIKAKGGQADIQSDLYTAIRLNSLTGLNVSEDITPGVVEQDAYVVLGYTATTKGQVSVSYNSNFVTYTYPLQFLNQNKNLIYDNGGAQVYR